MAGGDASQALDTGPFSVDSCSETQAQGNPYWRLDFGRIVKVSGLRVMGHSMCDVLRTSWLDAGVGIMPGSLREPVNTNLGAQCGCASSSAAPTAATAPSYSAQGGPEGAGTLLFNRDSSQHIAMGERGFSISRRGGLTAMAVVRFEGAAADGESIFDFGNGAARDNLILARRGTGTALVFQGCLRERRERKRKRERERDSQDCLQNLVYIISASPSIYLSIALYACFLSLYLSLHTLSSLSLACSCPHSLLFLSRFPSVPISLSLAFSLFPILSLPPSLSFPLSLSLSLPLSLSLSLSRLTTQCPPFCFTL